MNMRRIFALARRVMRQILRDVRTVALLVFAPMFVLAIGAVLFRSEPARLALGIVNEDAGVSLPMGGEMVIGERIVNTLAEGDVFELVPLEQRDRRAAARWRGRGRAHPAGELERHVPARTPGDARLTARIRAAARSSPRA